MNKMMHIQIPQITNPLGKHWKQPNQSEMIITNKQAVMTKQDFDSLMEYSTSIPTGVYEGKMWKTLANGKWYLRWYSVSGDPDKCDIKHIPISIYERKTTLK